MKTASFFKPILSIALLLACLACAPSKSVTLSDMDARGWSLAALKNATYSGLKANPGPVKLIEGCWQGAPYVEGGASRPSVHFVGDLYRIGKLSGNEAAVVFLSEASGGSGTFLYLAVVEKKKGGLVNTATAPLGDRVQIRDARIDNGEVAVDVLQRGPQDAACCPGELAVRRWQLSPRGLVTAAAPPRTGRLSLDVIANATWTLRAWDTKEPAPDEPPITLAYENGRLIGSAGCNRFFASVKPGDDPGDLHVGPPGATRMMCPEAIMAVEQRFLKQLNGVKKFGFLAGQLALSFEMAGKGETMRFDRQTNPP